MRNNHHFDLRDRICLSLAQADQQHRVGFYRRGRLRCGGPAVAAASVLAVVSPIKRPGILQSGIRYSATAWPAAAECHANPCATAAGEPGEPGYSKTAEGE